MFSNNTLLMLLTLITTLIHNEPEVRGHCLHLQQDRAGTLPLCHYHIELQQLVDSTPVDFQPARCVNLRLARRLVDLNEICNC